MTNRSGPRTDNRRGPDRPTTEGADAMGEPMVVVDVVVNGVPAKLRMTQDEAPRRGLTESKAAPQPANKARRATTNAPR